MAWRDRVCERCDLGLVDDEAHLLLECKAKALTDIRQDVEYASLPLQAGMGGLFRHDDNCLCAKYVSACMRAAAANTAVVRTDL